MNINGQKTVVKNNFAGYNLLIGKGVGNTMFNVCEQVRKAVSEKNYFSADDCVNCKSNCDTLN
ncbi:MAG: hypothetical protein PHZ26_01260 [Candidatus Gracilibacteria bacterium]|nr:hypothetical protein [Candidatus Gracilibacteria bacterium]MDD2908363.1 hypothetical protein [Candidatus Gracilibacteria bacterium]